jgi:ATP:ADP antiporter, AAA family
MASANPLKQILNIRREEWPQALLMFAYFFLVITTFWILKPLKKALFIGFYQQPGFDLGSWHMSAPQAELLAKVLNMLVAVAAVAVFSLLSRTLQRQYLTTAFCAFFLVTFAGYGLLIDGPGSLTVWSFYLFGDLYSTLMVATFFAFLNDSVQPDEAKRLYGLIGLGGVSGGWFGSEVLRVYISDLSSGQWMWICLGVTVAIAGIALLVGGIVDRKGSPAPVAPVATPKASEDPSAGNPAIEGARLVFRSPYLLSVVAIVGLYEMVSTIMDFQFSATVAHYTTGAELKQQFATVFAFTNRFAFFVQLLLTSFVMSRWGLGVALLFLPVAALMGSAAFLAAPVLLVGSALNTADGGFSYSINQSAKEALYVPTTRDEKYKAKAFIDMFVQRFAKAVAVGLSLLITTWFTGFESLRWLSLLTMGILVLWIIAARYAGRVFAQKEAATSS